MNKKMISILLLVMMIASCAPAYAKCPTQIFIDNQEYGHEKITTNYGWSKEIKAELFMVSSMRTSYPHGKL